MRFSYEILISPNNDFENNISHQSGCQTHEPRYRLPLSQLCIRRIDRDRPRAALCQMFQAVTQLDGALATDPYAGTRRRMPQNKCLHVQS
jgi:hypothetical protein